MARINRVEKSRKECKCGKCGKVIPVGSSYLYATPMHRAKMIRCTSCGLRSYETSSSEYVQTVGAIQENWRNEYGTDGIDGIISALEELKDNAECSLDNMPEQLQEGDTGMMLQDRIDGLEEAIDALENIDTDDLKQQAFDDLGEVDVNTEAFLDWCKENDIEDPSEYYSGKEDDEYVAVELNQLPNVDDFDTAFDLPFVDDDIQNQLNEAFEDLLDEEIGNAVGDLPE